MGTWWTIQLPKCNAMNKFYSLSVPQTNRWPRASTQSSQVKQAPTSIVCYVDVILDHLVLLLVDSKIFHQHDFFLYFCFLLQNRSRINNDNVYIFYMFGTSLKTGINCFCFKKNNYRNCNVEFLHDETRKDIEVAFANCFFFPKRHNIHIILQ